LESVFLELRHLIRDTELTSFILITRSESALLGGAASLSCKLSITLEGLRNLFSEPATLEVLSIKWNKVDLKGGFAPTSFSSKDLASLGLG
jgi:hypothetical protein